MNRKLTVAPLSYANLPEIDSVVPLGDKDAACLNEIRTALEKHDAIGRFGVCLLHKHFDLTDEEVLVEFPDPETRTLVTRPMRLSEVEPERQRIIDTMWQFGGDKDGPKSGQKCIQICTYNKNNKHIKKSHLKS